MSTTQNPVTQFHPPVGFCRAIEAAQLLGVSKSTFWLWVSNKTLNGVDVPQPIKLSPGVTVWRRSEISTFIEQLSAQANNAPTPPRAA
jgi:prophage regulatory protein